MSAAHDVSVRAELDLLSPELVLIDPRLSIGARNVLADPEDTLARILRRATLGDGRSFTSGTNADPASSTDEDIAAARRRITELSEVVPPKPRRRRFLTLVAVAGTSSALALLLLDLQLGLYQWLY